MNPVRAHHAEGSLPQGRGTEAARLLRRAAARKTMPPPVFEGPLT